MSPARTRALRLFALVIALSTVAAAPALAGDNAGVEVSMRRISDPCGLRGGQQVEFAVLARNMVGVAQVAITVSWRPASAVTDVAASMGSLPEEVGLIAPFSPLVNFDRAEFGMASLGSKLMDGDGELATFQIQLAQQVAGVDPVEVWVEAVSVGPSFAELDVIVPIQAVVLTNFCDDLNNPLEQMMLLSAEQFSTSFSPANTGAQLDGSIGETRVRARLLREVDFAIDQEVVWTVSNGGEFPLFVHADGTVLVLGAGGILTSVNTLSDLRGDTFLVLDVEGTLAGGRAAADISACNASQDRCAATRVLWDVAATAVATDGGSRSTAPLALDLGSNFPNPFNPTTTIPFTVPYAAGLTRLDVVNATGQLVTILVQERLTPGHHFVTWNGRTDERRAAASGVYFLRLTHDVGRLVRPMVLAR